MSKVESDNNFTDSSLPSPSSLSSLSSNGTFVNGVKVGKNKTQLLNNDDEISLSVKNNKGTLSLIIIIIISHTPTVFVFNDKSASEQYNNLPQVIN